MMGDSESAKIRRLLENYFDDAEVEFLCFDYYREVYSQFANGMTKRRKVHLLLEYCDNRGEFPTLSSIIRRKRPDFFNENEATRSVTSGAVTITIDEFLREVGFNDNPFATTNAEKELDNLSSYFVRVSWFNQLVGDTQKPESLILFAPQGHGKTSHRLEVGRFARSDDHPALVVDFTDFSMFLDLSNISTSSYLPLIQRKVMESFVSELKKEPKRKDLLLQNEEMTAQFCALQQFLALPERIFLAPDTTSQMLNYYEKHTFGFSEWLTILYQIVKQAGFASIYALFDSIDEWTETKMNREQAFRLIAPLLDSPKIFEANGFAFKFFLPQDIREELEKREIGRSDRCIQVHTLEWKKTELLNALSQRLTSYSRASDTDAIGRVQSFQQLCDTDDVNFNVDARLIEVAYPSPRKMIKLAGQIVKRHCETSSDASALIKAETINEVLGYNGDG